MGMGICSSSMAEIVVVADMAASLFSCLSCVMSCRRRREPIQTAVFKEMKLNPSAPLLPPCGRFTIGERGL